MVFDLSRSLDGWRGRTCAARRSRIDMVAIVAPVGGSPSADRGTCRCLRFRPTRTDYLSRGRSALRMWAVRALGGWMYSAAESGRFAASVQVRGHRRAATPPEASAAQHSGLRLDQSSGSRNAESWSRSGWASSEPASRPQVPTCGAVRSAASADAYTDRLPRRSSLLLNPGRPHRVRAAELAPQCVPALLHHRVPRGHPHPGAASSQGPDSPGSEHLALSAARRRPPGAGLCQRRVSDAAVQPVRLL